MRRVVAQRWVLALTSLAMYGNYYAYDAIGPVADLLQRELHFTDTQLGELNAIYSLPNVVLVLVGGILIDRLGAARIMWWTSVICLAGATLTALGSWFPVMAAGRLLFGIGSETLAVATLAGLAQWYGGGGLALAMALGVSLGRLGSFTVDLSPKLFPAAYAGGWQPPLVLAAALAATTTVCALGWLIVERRAARFAGATGAVAAVAAGGPAPAPRAPAERFRLADIGRFGAAYWYLLALNVLFFGTIFTFRSTFAIKYFQHTRGLSLDAAGAMNSVVFFTAVFATPAFGTLADRFGRRTLLLAAGAALLPATFAILAFTRWDLWISTALVGISFSLVPAVIWPCVAYLVDANRLGTAYGLINVLQNLALTLFNVIAGGLNDAAGASAAHPAGYQPMIAFFGIASAIATACALALLAVERGAGSYGLDRPRPLPPPASAIIPGGVP